MYLVFLLLCIFLITNEVEHLCIFYLAFLFCELPVKVFCPYFYCFLLHFFPLIFIRFLLVSVSFLRILHIFSLLIPYQLYMCFSIFLPLYDCLLPFTNRWAEALHFNVDKHQSSFLVLKILFTVFSYFKAKQTLSYIGLWNLYICVV